MIDNILTAFLVVASVGLVSAVLLALASHFLHVKEDENIKRIRECLPGVNCGACGYTGCDDYAKAVASGNAVANLCIPGADAVAEDIANIIGAEPADVIEMVAFVCCNGTDDVTVKKADYKGINICSASSMIYGGPNSCRYGCLGCGDCANVCPVNAICIDGGLARVNTNICIGCGMCAEQCPKNIIELVPKISKVAVLCNNKDKGAFARRTCKNACIGCKSCELNCEHNAITVKNNIAVIDYNKCTGCGNCITACPINCIKAIG